MTTSMMMITMVRFMDMITKRMGMFMVLTTRMVTFMEMMTLMKMMTTVKFITMTTRMMTPIRTGERVLLDESDQGSTVQPSGGVLSNNLYP